MKLKDLLPKMLGKDYGFYINKGKFTAFYETADDYYESPMIYNDCEVEYIGIKEGRLCVCVKESGECLAG